MQDPESLDPTRQKLTDRGYQSVDLECSLTPSEHQDRTVGGRGRGFTDAVKLRTHRYPGGPGATGKLRGRLVVTEEDPSAEA